MGAYHSFNMMIANPTCNVCYVNRKKMLGRVLGDVSYNVDFKV